MLHIFSSDSRLILLCLSALLLLGACNSSKYLAEDEYLVKKNKIDLVEESNVEDWSSLRIELLGQLSTVPNGKFFFIWPREWFYLRGEAREDTTRFSRFVRNAIAESPAYQDSEKVQENVGRLRAFMRNRGFFDTEVSVQIDTLKRQRVAVSYLINSSAAYQIDSIHYKTDNKIIQGLLTKTKDERHIKPGDRVDSRLYDKETARIVSLLRNHGFANFYANSISPLEADSTGNLVNATLKILDPEENRKHHTFRVGKITVFPDSDPLATSQSVAIDTTQDGIRFIYEDEKMAIHPGTLVENIFFRPGQLFDQSAISKSNIQLNSLGVFRLVSIRQSPSEDEDEEIDFFIELSLNPQWTIGSEADLSFTDRLSTSNTRLSLIGPQVLGSLGNRNIAGGAEKLNLSIDAGLEFNFADIGNKQINRLNTVEFGAQSGLELPRFTDFLGFYRGLNRTKSSLDENGEPTMLLPSTFYNALEERGTTNLKLEARYVSILENYTTTTFSALYGFDVLAKPTDRYTINHIGLEYLLFNSESAAFDTLLLNAPQLARSLGTQVFSGFLLRNISYSHISNPSLSRGTWTVLFDIEQSGLEVFGANQIRNLITESETVFTIFNGLDYARYGRLALSIAYRKQAARRQEIAARFNTGTALTYGFLRRDRDVPYVRQFFGGGNSSLRGWQARSVGPGGYIQPPQNFVAGFINYQQANFKLEANVEARSFLTNIWTTRLDGAIFFDVGNIWTWKYDADRLGSQFRFTELVEDGVVVNDPFYKQIAINTGVGLRWDIGYVLLRVDMGIKLRNPYKINGSYWPKDFTSAGLNRIDNFALGLNYPF